jgi:hypothetical protein
MITVGLAGGLGNQLFQLAAVDHIARRSGRQTIICSHTESHHSKENYFNSLFRNWSIASNPPTFPLNIQESSYVFYDWRSALDNPHNARIHGYFQNWQYVDESFKERLWFNTGVLAKYPDIGNKVFIHVRGGDYVNHWLHDIKLDDYYGRAIAEFPADTQFVIFTNDFPYASTRPWISGIQHTFIHENEVDTLLLMSKCGGCICPNSSFSWWGAFLNQNRKIVMPEKWFNDPNIYIDGYYFPGVVKCSV